MQLNKQHIYSVGYYVDLKRNGAFPVVLLWKELSCIIKRKTKVQENCARSYPCICRKNCVKINKELLIMLTCREQDQVRIFFPSPGLRMRISLPRSPFCLLFQLFSCMYVIFVIEKKKSYFCHLTTCSQLQGGHDPPPQHLPVFLPLCNMTVKLLPTVSQSFSPHPSNLGSSHGLLWPIEIMTESTVLVPSGGIKGPCIHPAFQEESCQAAM